jgi:hypothetical protein
MESLEQSPNSAPVFNDAPDLPHPAHLRALRRKARRISAYARLSTHSLTSLALAVESDLAALRH